MRQIAAFSLHPNDACPIVVLPEPKEAGNMQKQVDLELHRLDQILWRARKRLEWMNRSVLDAAALKAAKDFATRRVKTLPFIRASREALIPSFGAQRSSQSEIRYRIPHLIREQQSHRVATSRPAISRPRR
jgi:hypothetical protein